MIREQLELARRELRCAYDRHLPRFGRRGRCALPRVYHLARDLVAGADHALDAAHVREFVNACQRRTVLTLAELWSVAAMLRLVLVEKLSELADCANLQCGPGDPALQGETVGDDPVYKTEADEIGKTISSLRALGRIDWKEFVE